MRESARHQARGGVDQPAMRTAANLLARGDWVHLFPEGRVSKTGTLGPMRRGLAKLLCDVEIAGGEAPIVLPFWHSGMDVIKPYGKWSMAVGERVHVTVGEPLDFRDLTAKCARSREKREGEGSPARADHGSRGERTERIRGEKRSRTRGDVAVSAIET